MAVGHRSVTSDLCRCQPQPACDPTSGRQQEATMTEPQGRPEHPTADLIQDAFPGVLARIGVLPVAIADLLTAVAIAVFPRPARGAREDHARDDPAPCRNGGARRTVRSPPARARDSHGGPARTRELPPDRVGRGRDRPGGRPRPRGALPLPLARDYAGASPPSSCCRLEEYSDEGACQVAQVHGARGPNTSYQSVASPLLALSQFT